MLILLIVIRRKKRDNQRFYMIGSISLADIVTILMADIIAAIAASNSESEMDWLRLIIWTIGGAAHLTSVLTNLFLSADRFIAVRYCLTYHNIVTPRRVLFVMSINWFFALIIISLLTIGVPNRFRYSFRCTICMTIVRVLVAILMIAISVYTSITRKKHVESIQNRNKYFGIHQEKMDMLTSLKNSLTATFKLNIATVALALSQSVVDFLRSFPSTASMQVNVATLMLLLLLKLSNFIAIITTQKELRSGFHKLCCSAAFRTFRRPTRVQNSSSN